MFRAWPFEFETHEKDFCLCEEWAKAGNSSNSDMICTFVHTYYKNVFFWRNKLSKKIISWWLTVGFKKNDVF